MNEVLFFVTLIVMFGAVVLAHKFFGKAGLFGYVAFAIILAEIEVSCNVNMFGFPDTWVTLGNVAFASIFLACDILNECYGAKESKKAIRIAICSIVLFFGIIQLDLLFTPSSESFMHETLRTYFGWDSIFFCITISSIVCFALANFLDVFIFDKLKKKTKGKHLWLRNNVSTIISNCAENFLFVFLGYYLFPIILTGKQFMPTATFIGIALSTSAIEILLGLLDTPFMYLAKKYSKQNVINLSYHE